MKYIDFYLIKNFNMAGQTTLFGWCVNYISIRSGSILIEIYFQNRTQAFYACRNLESSFLDGSITVALKVHDANLLIPVRIVNYWFSISEPRNLLIELKMPH